MNNEEKLELIRLSATNFEGFKKKFETLSPSEQTEFKNHMEMLQDYLKKNYRQRIEERTGFPPPS